LLFERLPWVSCRATPDIDAEKLRTPGNHGGNIIELTSWKCFSISLEDLEVSAYTAPNKHHHTPWICHSAAVQMCPASYRSVFYVAETTSFPGGWITHWWVINFHLAMARCQLSSEMPWHAMAKSSIIRRTPAPWVLLCGAAPRSLPSLHGPLKVLLWMFSSGKLHGRPLSFRGLKALREGTRPFCV
jgi:hypothetical protein